MEKPERHGKKWEKDEEEFVLARIGQGALPMTIAREVKRTTGGIISHLREIACRWICDGKPIEEASTLTGLPVDDIQDALKRRELAKQMKELSKRKETPIRPFFLSKSEETELDVLRDIRSLLEELVKNTKTLPGGS
jgi:hypothetical protein